MTDRVTPMPTDPETPPYPDGERYTIGVKAITGRWFVLDRATDEVRDIYATRDEAIERMERLNQASTPAPEVEPLHDYEAIAKSGTLGKYLRAEQLAEMWDTAFARGRASVSHVDEGELAPHEWDEADGMCPNCVTPWKCNGPHVLQPPATTGREPT